MALVTSNGAVLATAGDIDPNDVVFIGGIAHRASDGAMYVSFTGGVEASVQPRSGLLADLLALAGLPGEVSYPTDAPAMLVRHTGVAGKAQWFFTGQPCYLNGSMREEHGTHVNMIATGEWENGTFHYDPKIHGKSIEWKACAPDIGKVIFDLTKMYEFYSTYLSMSPCMSVDVFTPYDSAAWVQGTYSDDGGTNYITSPEVAIDDLHGSFFKLYMHSENTEVWVRSVQGPVRTSAQWTCLNAGTTVLSRHCPTHALSCTGTIASHTVVLPIGDDFEAVYGRSTMLDIAWGTGTVTSLTVKDVANNAPLGTALTTATAGTIAGYIWQQSARRWRRMY